MIFIIYVFAFIGISVMICAVLAYCYYLDEKNTAERDKEERRKARLGRVYARVGEHEKRLLKLEGVNQVDKKSGF